MISKNNKLHAIFAFILCLANSIVLMVIVWSCFRGLDLSDESYYYLGYLFYDNQPNLSPSSFHMVYYKLFSSFNFTIEEIRFLRLFLTLVTSIILFLGTKKIANIQNSIEKIILFNVLLSGMLLSYSWAPLTLSYNTMSSILIGSIVGFWMLGITSINHKLKISITIILGVLFTLLFFVKITNLILLGILIVATLYILNKKNLLQRLKTKLFAVYFAAFGIGIIACLALLSNSIHPMLIQHNLSEYINQFFSVIENDSTHSASHLLKRYYENAKMVLIKLKYPLSILIALYFLLRLFKKPKNIFLREILFKLVGLITLTVMVFENHYWLGGTKTKYTMLITYIFIVSFVFLNNLLEKKTSFFLLSLSFLTIPIAGAAGTNNGLSAQVLFYGVFIFLTIYYLTFSSKYFYFKYTLLTFIVCLCSSQVIFATVFHPYQQSNLKESKNQLENATTLPKLMVDNSLLNLSNELAFLEKYDPEYIFAYSAQRGIVLLTSKKPYSLEWFNEQAVKKTCAVINKSNIAPNNIIFLIPEKVPLHEETLQCLEKKGVFFNKNYSLVKKINYFDYYFNKQMVLNVYLPFTETQAEESNNKNNHH